MSLKSTLPLLAFALALALAACKREPEPASSTAVPATESAPATIEAPPAAMTPPELKDVIETNDRYVIGVSYPAGLQAYPGLALALADYTNAARAELMEAVDGFGNDKPPMPYELSLAYEKLAETPQLVAVAADGSRYTGGAHGQPLIARFVWLPQAQQMLTAEALIPDPAGWSTVSAFVREQLRDAVETRAENDALEPAERAALVKSSSKMIDEGTAPAASNFEQFVPVLDDNGKITALRFVFAPYQVGPYADGTQTVDVPAGILYPHVAPAYLELFARP